MFGMNWEGGESKRRRSETLHKHWSEMCGLSEQLTEATLVAMEMADANSPGKALLDIPLPACPQCSSKDTIFVAGSSEESTAFPLSGGGSGVKSKRYGRSKSIAIAPLADDGCGFCNPYFYQNPLKDNVWSRPNVSRYRSGPIIKRNSCRSRFSSEIPCDFEDSEKIRFAVSVEPPVTASQHTQTIFSSIPTNNDAGNPLNTRSRQTSGSAFTKTASGHRFQLPGGLHKSKSMGKSSLGFGLRKTLSITNAIVRMPIESATQTSKKGSKTQLNDSHSPDYPQQRDPLLNTELLNSTSEGGYQSLSVETTFPKDGTAEETIQPETLPRITRSASNIERKPISFNSTRQGKSLGKPHWLYSSTGTRDVQLQTMEDFEKEITGSFTLPRILREEDQIKEPNSADSERLEIGASIEGTLRGLDDPLKARSTDYWKDQFIMFFQPSDNKLTKKLFGTKMALNKERSRQRKHGKWIIHPASNFRFYWDLLMLVLLIANLIILPIFIAFFLEDLGIQAICFNCVSDTIFLLDILVNFRTGILANKFAEEIILNPKKIAHHYLRTWFALDFISSIPIDYIFLLLSDEAKARAQLVSAGRALRILRLVKLLSLLRLLRITRLVRYVSQWEQFLNVANKFMGIFNLVLLMLLLGHWNACLQFLIPMLNNYPVDSWVMKCKLRDADWFEQYTWALFKAMSHMLSIGYGRFPPTSASEAWITIISMMIGSTCYALFVGHAAALIQSFDCSKKMYREKFKQVEEYMAYRKLPRVLRQKIANYYEHRYQGKMYNEVVILDELSECLREEIVNHNCRELVAAVPFFTYADHHFVSEVIMKLKYEVFQPGDWIIKEGHLGTKMYFIQEGFVDIVDTDGRVATSLSDGSYFGEICLLTNARRTASVRAETYCNLYALDRTSFHEVLQNYPFMRRTLESVAAERLHQLGRDPMTVIRRKNIQEDLEIVKEIVSQAERNVHEDDTSSDASSNSSSSTNKTSHTRCKRKTKNHEELEKVDEECSETPNSLTWSRGLRTRLYQRYRRYDDQSTHYRQPPHLSFLRSPRYQPNNQLHGLKKTSGSAGSANEQLMRRRSSNSTALKLATRRSTDSIGLCGDTVVTDPGSMAGTSESSPAPSQKAYRANEADSDKDST